MYVGEAKGVARLPEKAPEPPRDTGLKLEKGEEAPNFDNMISESNILRQAEIEKEKNEAGGDFRLGETKNDREFRKQLEKVTGKKQDLAKNKMERDDYLNLLVTQLKYQDPAKPMEHYEMASQMAQFNTVEQLMGVNKVLTEMKKLQNDAKAEKLSQYLGKDIEIQGNNIKLTQDGKANTAKFDLPAAASNVIVEFRDEHSKTVKSIHMGALQPGNNKVVWDGTNDKGVKLPNGSYTFNILASTEDGKPMTAKTSYIAKVEGITDILSGGKLDTDVGPADPAKIIAIRNPENNVTPVKPQKSQIANYVQNSNPNPNAKQTDNANPLNPKSSETQKPLNNLDGMDLSQNTALNKNAALNNNSDEFMPYPSKSDPITQQGQNSFETKITKNDINNSQTKMNNVAKMPSLENGDDMKFSPKKPDVKSNQPRAEIPPKAEAIAKPKPQENYSDVKAAPKYGGPPTVAGISGKQY